MIYDVRQITTYDYEAPVAFSRHIARLTPADRLGQRVIAAQLNILPAPSERDESRDFFGNRITGFALHAPHHRLTVDLIARVEVRSPAPLLINLSPAWEDIRDLAPTSDQMDANALCHGLYFSRLISFEAAITAYCAACFTPGRPIIAATLALTERIKADFTYKPGATGVSTPPAEAFRQKLGVCQDFTQIMIAGLRGLGLPIRYVSGYLRTDPPAGRPRLEGADATHAWAEVWCGGDFGWIGFDPTNGILAGEDHLILAVGRDYADISPLDGVVVAAAGHRLRVTVDVVPVSRN
jgi:transglutaminase-like putative cysteine protease